MDGFQDCHVVKIVHHKGRWEIKVLYHPSIESLGRVRTEIMLFDIQVVGDYEIISRLRD